MNAIKKFKQFVSYLMEKNYLEQFNELYEMECDSIELIFNLEQDKSLKMTITKSDITLSKLLENEEVKEIK